MLKIVISPAKKMNITDEFPCNATVPVFSDRADVLHGILKNKKMLKVRGIFKVLLNILYDELKYSILKLAIIII